MAANLKSYFFMYQNVETMKITLKNRQIDWVSMRRILLCLPLSMGFLLGCADNRPLRTPSVADEIRSELAPVKPQAKVEVPSRISQVLAEPAPPLTPIPPEPRLDLLVNNAQAREVFLAIVADTRYSMLMHPDVAGTLSVTLRGVTVKEALEAIRDVYGYDFKIEGRRITVYSPTLQTRIFTVNYPHSLRVGRSELRVASGVASGIAPATPGIPGAAAAAAAAIPGATGNTAANSALSRQTDSSRLTTSSQSDFWGELTEAIRSMIGNGAGRNVISSPQAGIMAIRAMPEELRQVEKFLKAAQIAVERQVMLEAKIVEVELRDGYQSGVNWAALGTDGRTAGAVGVIGSGGSFTTTTGQAIPGVVPFPQVNAGGGLFGLALATSQFASVMGFLETQGNVQTLSSPRVATLNNQKAVLKVGSDDYFVTGITGGSTTAASVGVAGTTTLPTMTLTPFFSGIALDVTPQIDEANNIVLHVHPSVTTVTERTKEVDLGTVGLFRLPLASSVVNETDTMVRIQDGNIVAIGGLMQSSEIRSASGLPGSNNASNALGFLLGNRAKTGGKKELVVLIKPSIIRTAQDWEAQTVRSRAALEDMEVARSRVIRLDGTAQGDAAKSSTQ
jgi:MSHA biogenesis protein MshL